MKAADESSHDMGKELGEGIYMHPPGGLLDSLR
jgi:hypothetical protein